MFMKLVLTLILGCCLLSCEEFNEVIFYRHIDSTSCVIDGGRPVTYKGIKIGEIADVKLRNDYVMYTAELDPEFILYNGAKASIASNSILNLNLEIQISNNKISKKVLDSCYVNCGITPLINILESYNNP